MCHVDDLLVEILLRLPPQPSTIPRAALVCKRWRCLVTDPQFARRFRAHHWTPSFLGFLLRYGSFVPAQDPLNRVPVSRFSLGKRGSETSRWGWQLLGCRHGLILCENTEEFLVFNPMSGDRRRIPFSAEIEVSTFITAALVAAAGVVDCASFRLVALFTDDAGTNVSASVYSSDSSVWVDSVATLVLPSPTVFIHYPSTLVGNAVYWLLDGVILQFDLETQSLAIIEKPPDANVGDDFRCQIMATEDARFGLAVLAESSILFWKRETDPSSGAKWVLCRTVQLDRFLPLGKKGLRHPLGRSCCSNFLVHSVLTPPAACLCRISVWSLHMISSCGLCAGEGRGRASSCQQHALLEHPESLAWVLFSLLHFVLVVGLNDDALMWADRRSTPNLIQALRTKQFCTPDTGGALVLLAPFSAQGVHVSLYYNDCKFTTKAAGAVKKRPTQETTIAHSGIIDSIRVETMTVLATSRRGAPRWQEVAPAQSVALLPLG